MKNILQQRKGVSEMVSYALLVVIAIGLSILVYSFLKSYTPKNATECTDKVSISIESAACVGNSLQVTLRNTGLFTIDAAYVRLGQAGKSAKVLVNNPGQTAQRDSDYHLDSANGAKGLLPGQNSVPYDIGITRQGYNIIEVEPVIRSQITGKDAACKNAIVTAPISC